MPDVPLKCIWWAFAVVILTGHFCIDTGTYLTGLGSWCLQPCSCFACSSSDAIDENHKDYLQNGNTTFVDTSNLLDAFRDKMLDHGSGKEWKSALSRRKRDLLFPSGVKLCSHETVQQAVQNHLNYFHLRGKNMIVWLLLVFEWFWHSLQKTQLWCRWMLFENGMWDFQEKWAHTV